MTPPPFDSRPRPRESDDLGCAHRVPRLPQAIRVPRAAPATGRAMCSARGRARMRRVRRPRAGSTKPGAADARAGQRRVRGCRRAGRVEVQPQHEQPAGGVSEAARARRRQAQQGAGLRAAAASAAARSQRCRRRGGAGCSKSFRGRQDAQDGDSGAEAALPAARDARHQSWGRASRRGRECGRRDHPPAA